LVLALSWSPLAAQEDEEEELEMELFFAPAETVTSATKHEQPLSESPSAVTVLTHEDIQASGARTLPEALRLVPNMDVYMIKPFWYAVGVRGRTTDESDRMLLVVDGRDVTSELLGAPLWTVQYFSMDDVERIEVIRGPGSALYGANAYSGVVHVITRLPGEGSRATVSVRGGEQGQAELSCRVSETFSGVSLAAMAGLVQEDLWTSRDFTSREIIRSRLDAKIELGPDTHLTFEAGALQGSGMIQTAMGLMHLKDVQDYYGRIQFDLAGLNVQASFDRTPVDASLDLALRIKDPPLELASVPGLIGTVDKAGLLARYSFSAFFNRVTLGAEYVLNTFDSASLIPDHHTEHRTGAFVQDEIRLNELLEETADIEIPPLILTVGLRFDYDIIIKDQKELAGEQDDWQDWELSPRASLVFTPGESHSFRLGFSHAYLKPSFLQSSIRIGVDDVSSLGIHELNMGNPDLENQTIDSLELAYSARFLDGRFTVGLDFAYNWHRNTIWFEQDPDKMDYIEIGSVRFPDISSSNGFTFTNHPEGLDSHNLDLQLVGKPTEDLRLFVQAGYRQSFYNETGLFDGHEPVFRAGAGGDLRTGFGLALSVRAFFTASRDAWLLDPESLLEPGGPYRVPASLLLNARIAWTLVSRPFEFTIGLEGFNLLDRRFRENSGIFYPNQPDYNGERLDRRIILFVHGQI
jgi:iron complex outermembrane receptor protein